MKHKKWLILVGAAWLAAGSQAYGAEPPPRQQPDGKPSPDAALTEVRSEESAVKEAARKRRYEIMVLLQAYRILPEEQKPAVKEEILARLHADYLANREDKQRMIAFLEAELARLKREATEENPDVDAAVAAEFERLTSLPIGGMGPQGWLPPCQKDEGPRRPDERDAGRRGDRQRDEGPGRPGRDESRMGMDRDRGPGRERDADSGGGNLPPPPPEQL